MAQPVKHTHTHERYLQYGIPMTKKQNARFMKKYRHWAAARGRGCPECRNYADLLTGVETRTY